MDWQEQRSTENADDFTPSCIPDNSLILLQERSEIYISSLGAILLWKLKKMLLQLREGHQVSQVALAEVISCCRSLCNTALTHLKTDLATALLNGEDPNIAPENYDPFKNVDMNYLFEKYCCDHLGCLVS